MKKLNEMISLVDDLKLYNLCDVVGDFKSYFGFDIEEINELFKGRLQITSVDIYEGLFEFGFCGSEMLEVGNMYDFNDLKLCSLNYKMNNLINLIRYICGLDVVIESNDFYEKELKGWGIEHFSSVLLGKDVKKLLMAIDQVLEEVLSCDVYNRSFFGVVRERKFGLK